MSVIVITSGTRTERSTDDILSVVLVSHNYDVAGVRVGSILIHAPCGIIGHRYSCMSSNICYKPAGWSRDILTEMTAQRID